MLLLKATGEHSLHFCTFLNVLYISFGFGMEISFSDASGCGQKKEPSQCSHDVKQTKLMLSTQTTCQCCICSLSHVTKPNSYVALGDFSGVTLSADTCLADLPIFLTAFGDCTWSIVGKTRASDISAHIFLAQRVWFANRVVLGFLVHLARCPPMEEFIPLFISMNST